MASSSTNNNNDTTTITTTTTTHSMDDARIAILQSSLEHVHAHGWTEDAIAAGVLSLRYPASMMGMVSTHEVVQFFMDDCNRQFQQELQKAVEEWNAKHLSVTQRLAQALQMRLTYVIPFVDSHRWHEGMAMGAMPPTQMSITASQLEHMISNVCTAVIQGTNHPPLTPLEQTAIGAVYVATELHLLTDTSVDKQDTWTFCQSRLGELEFVAQSSNMSSILNGTAAVATVSVASSLGSAVLSLAQPAARGMVSMAASTFVPQIATLMQQAGGRGEDLSNATMTSYTKTPKASSSQGTTPSDYETPSNLPPFPSETK
eukprot:CAMPEP_0195289740 /NCGR_PEP_ID=MMETSP0707-20130614/5889_1 /TAXON_ID=33640 /ORGANISM="Asterionellopsis glacialis, Strain CCMP134" /LENGTH=315 /DNA_ID=CAMNT_0040349775 /DNA_START=138 /DNA_END=1085 /DNA_ORIENTATION=-